MKINLVISGGVHSSQSAYSAYQFCRAALEQGHEVSQVFFYQQAVDQSNSLILPMSDEFDAPRAWQQLAREYGVQLSICISSAERRGMWHGEPNIGDEEALSVVAEGFVIVGLASLHAASIEADRSVCFH